MPLAWTGARRAARSAALRVTLVVTLTGAWLGATPAAAQPRDEALLALATAEQAALVKTLERLVNLETGAGHPEGLKGMVELLDTELRAIGASVTRHKPGAGMGGENIVARLKGPGTRKVLMMAHIDTVYPPGTLARSPFRIDGPRAYGPGVADAKAGAALMLHAARILKARGDLGGLGELTLMFNNDEERGSPGSRDLIRQLAGEHDAVLSYEPTVAIRELFVRATSGTANIEVRVKGKASHAGAAPELGVNALVEASDIVLRTLDLDDKSRDLRFNWTLGQAGSAANVIPEEAVITANVRYATEADLQALVKVVEERAQRKRVPGAEVKVTVLIGRPAFNADAASLRLLERAVAIYKEVGGEITVIPRTGGGTDAGFAALSGKPVLEGLGLPGFGYHSTQAEYAMIDAVARRLYLTLRLVGEIAAHRLP